MTKEKYIKTFNICGHKIDLGLDDYGQCYFIEWTDSKGAAQSANFGSYDSDYMRNIYYTFDNRYRELSKKELFGELNDSERAEMNHYQEIFNEEYKK